MATMINFDYPVYPKEFPLMALANYLNPRNPRAQAVRDETDPQQSK
jgi:hypothetical protein